MKGLIRRLEAKWGAFEADQCYLKQWDTSKGKQKSYLNILFYPVASTKYQFAKDILNCEFPRSLTAFYQKYNGMMLFSESLRIYGVETRMGELYDSYDLVAQNKIDDIIAYGDQFANFVVFGCYSSCLFCFDKTDSSLLYVVDTDQEKIVYQFKSVTELLAHYIDYLIDEYDANGMKIHFDKSLEGLPLANVSLEFI